jgi:hypothetical protein
MEAVTTAISCITRKYISLVITRESATLLQTRCVPLLSLYLFNVFHSRWLEYLKQSQGDTLNYQYLHLRRHYSTTIDVSILLTCWI